MGGFGGGEFGLGQGEFFADEVVGKLADAGAEELVFGGAVGGGSFEVEGADAVGGVRGG